MTKLPANVTRTLTIPVQILAFACMKGKEAIFFKTVQGLVLLQSKAPVVPTALSTTACLVTRLVEEAGMALLFSSMSPFDDLFSGDTKVFFDSLFLVFIPGCRRCWTSARTGGAASFSSIVGCLVQIPALERASTSSSGTSADQVSMSLLNLFALA